MLSVNHWQTSQANQSGKPVRLIQVNKSKSLIVDIAIRLINMVLHITINGLSRELPKGSQIMYFRKCAHLLICTWHPSRFTTKLTGNQSCVCSCYSYVHVILMFMLFLCSCYSYVHVILMFMLFLCSCYSYVHVILMFMLFLCSCYSYVNVILMFMLFLC